MSFQKINTQEERDKFVQEYISTRKQLRDKLLGRQIQEAAYEAQIEKQATPITKTITEQTKAATEAATTAAEQQLATQQQIAQETAQQRQLMEQLLQQAVQQSSIIKQQSSIIKQQGQYPQGLTKQYYPAWDALQAAEQAGGRLTSMDFNIITGEAIVDKDYTLDPDITQQGELILWHKQNGQDILGYKATPGLVLLAYMPSENWTQSEEAVVTTSDAVNYVKILRESGVGPNDATASKKRTFLSKVVRDYDKNNKTNYWVTPPSSEVRGLGYKYNTKHVKSNPYKVVPFSDTPITGRGVFGDLQIDLDKLKNYLKLVAYGPNNDVVLKKKIHPDFVELVTKRFNPKKQYDGGAVNDFRELVKLAKLPVSKNSGKFKLLYGASKVSDQEPEKTYYTVSYDDLINELDEILSTLQIGNNNPDLINKAMQIIEILLNNSIIDKSAHKILFNKLKGFISK